MRDFREAVASFDVAAWLRIFTDVRPSGFDNVSVSPCPICGSAERKFYVNTGGRERNGLYQGHCCHQEGNLVKLVSIVENLSEIEARGLIRAESGERMFVPQAEAVAPVERGRALCLPAPHWPANPAMSIMDKGELRTLADRLLDQATIERYQIVVTGGSGTTYNGRPRRDLDARVVFPVLDPQGQLLSWLARDLTGQAANKYVFPGGAAATDTFFGFTRGIDGLIIVVEGVFQKIAWDRLGPEFHRRTVASFGKKLTHAQIELLLAAPAPSIVLAWDLDAIPQMCQYALQLRGRKKVFFMPPLEPVSGKARDHDEATPAELLELSRGVVEATPELIINLSVRAAMGEFKPKARAKALALS